MNFETLFRLRPILAEQTTTRAATAIVFAALLSMLVKVAAIARGGVQLSNTDGTSRLFVAIDRFNDAYLTDLSTWSGLPLPIPQMFYSLAYAIEVATGGAVASDVFIFVFNVLAFTGAVILLGFSVSRIAGGRAGLICVLLCVSAYMPNFLSLTTAVEPLAILFFSAAIFFSLRSLVQKQTGLFLIVSAIALAFSTSFRLEYYFLIPVFAVVLFPHHGWRKTGMFLVISLSFVVLYQGLQFISSDAIPYSNMEKIYSYDTLSLSRFFSSALATTGFLKSWGAPITLLSVGAAIYGCFVRQYRFISLLPLLAISLIFAAALAGKITAGQPRYAALGVFLLAAPASIALVQCANAVDRMFHHRQTPFVFLAVAFAVIVLAAHQNNEVLTARSNSPRSESRELSSWLTQHTQTGDSVLLDFAASEELPIAIKIRQNTGAPTYTYLTRCCVHMSDSPSMTAQEKVRLTADRSVLMPALSHAEKLTAIQVWAHGFIEKNKPKYIVTLRPAAWRQWASTQPTHDLASTIQGDMNSERTVIELSLADLSFRIEPAYYNKRYIVYEATYEDLR